MDDSGTMEEHGSPASDHDLDLTALPPLGEVLDGLTGHVAAWMHTQRWYAHKGTGVPRVQLRGWAPLRIAFDHPVSYTHLTLPTKA